MRKLVVTEFVTLDGVMEDPGGGEAFERGGWAFQFERGEEGDRFKLDELMASDVLLLGRRTYEGFAQAWPAITDEAGFADRMNSMRKVVVSSTLERPEWTNSTVLAGDPVEGVRALKAEGGGDILLAGSAQLAQTLAPAGPGGERRLGGVPRVRGAGERLVPPSATGLEPRRVWSAPHRGGAQVRARGAAGP